MSLRIIEMNILKATDNIIVQQVNCRGVMGSGLAKQIRAEWPHVYTLYKERVANKNPESLLGTMQIVDVSNDDTQFVANLFGQLDYGRDDNRYTIYNALTTALKTLMTFAVTHGYTVAIPYQLGCGLGGGDWNKVSDIIESVFVDYIEMVTIYKLPEKKSVWNTILNT
jgi:O-acetyl-ADP-ribose deacetylase (regulator of RNase III)